MMILLTEDEYNLLKNHDARLEARNEIKNRLRRVIKLNEGMIEGWPGGTSFLRELTQALESL